MEMELVESITICDVGPRDGLQNEKKLLSVQEKQSMIEGLANAGVPVIEVGSFVHPKAVPQMATTDEIFQNLHRKEGTEYRALIANLKGVERAVKCGCPKVKMNVSASKAHNLANLNCTPAETVASFRPCADMARTENIELSGSIAMAFGSPWEGEIPLSDVKEIVDAYLSVGITEISLSDTAGLAYPTQVYAICTEMAQAYPQVTWWLHFHNTRGLGIANVIAGMQAGFTRYDAASAGIGGCPFVPGAAGNIATEDVVHLCEECGVDTGIDLDQIISISRHLTEILGHSTDSYILRAGKARDLIKEL